MNSSTPTGLTSSLIRTLTQSVVEIRLKQKYTRIATLRAAIAELTRPHKPIASNQNSPNSASATPLLTQYREEVVQSTNEKNVSHGIISAAYHACSTLDTHDDGVKAGWLRTLFRSSPTKEERRQVIEQLWSEIRKRIEMGRPPLIHTLNAVPLTAASASSSASSSSSSSSSSTSLHGSADDYIINRNSLIDIQPHPVSEHRHSISKPGLGGFVWPADHDSPIWMRISRPFDGAPSITELIEQYECDPNEHDSYGLATIHKIVMMTHPKYAQCDPIADLQELFNAQPPNAMHAMCDIDLRILAADRDTPLHLCAKVLSSSHIVHRIYIHLLRCGANPTLKNREGYNALHLFLKVRDLNEYRHYINAATDPTTMQAFTFLIERLRADHPLDSIAAYRQQQLASSLQESSEIPFVGYCFNLANFGNLVRVPVSGRLDAAKPVCDLADALLERIRNSNNADSQSDSMQFQQARDRLFQLILNHSQSKEPASVVNRVTMRIVRSTCKRALVEHLIPDLANIIVDYISYSNVQPTTPIVVPCGLLTREELQRGNNFKGGGATISSNSVSSGGPRRQPSIVHRVTTTSD